MAQTSVHAAHCCKTHGCKYGDDLECPVVLGKVSGTADCEDCAEVRDYESAQQDAQSDDAWASFEDSARIANAEAQLDDLAEDVFSARTDGSGRDFE